MWALWRMSILGTEIVSIEIGHQRAQPQVVDDTDVAAADTHTGGTVHDFDRRPVEDVRDTRGWLPIGFTRSDA